MHWFTVENNTPVQHFPGKMIVMPDGSKQRASVLRRPPTGGPYGGHPKPGPAAMAAG